LSKLKEGLLNASVKAFRCHGCKLNQDFSLLRSRLMIESINAFNKGTGRFIGVLTNRQTRAITHLVAGAFFPYRSFMTRFVHFLGVVSFCNQLGEVGRRTGDLLLQPTQFLS
jgi:hypothetical protein